MVIEMPNIHELAVQIVRFVDAHQPGVVEAEFVDANGTRHTIIDKVLIFTVDELSADTIYPVQGAARCEVLDRYEDSLGRGLAFVSVKKPDFLESTEGLTEFTVRAASVSART
jgi:hypothetical protein